MQSKAEPSIKQSYFCQITPQRYTLNDSFIDYETSQRIFANSVSLRNFSIYNQFPNISPDYRMFQVFVNNITYNIVISSQDFGFYDIFTMQTLIQNYLNIQAPQGVWSITLSGIDNKFTRIQNSLYPFKLIQTNNPGLQQIYRYLGFSATIDPGFTTLSNNHLSLYPYSVQVTQNLNIQLKGCGQMFSDTVSVIAQVPLSSPIQTGLFWEEPYYGHSRHIMNKQGLGVPISQFQISILDDNGNTMPLSGQRVSATLCFESYN